MAAPSSALKSRLLELRKAFEQELEAAPLEAASREGGARGGLELGRRLVQAYDDLLAPVFAAAKGAPVALAAVGGYGRRALALRSDLDIRILARNAGDAERVADAILYPLWDTGLSIGHQSLLLGDVHDLARLEELNEHLFAPGALFKV